MTARRRFIQIGSAAAAISCLPLRRSVAETDESLRRAMEAMTAAIPAASADPVRPVYHFHPPANHTNDPNGTIFYKGWHHLFYQLNPYAAKWGNIHWGHARSRDLVNWQHLPIALCPDTQRGETQCFSGSAMIAEDGLPRILYTSIGRGMPLNPEQWLAIPQDDELIRWQRFAGNPVLTEAIHGNKRVEDWRDPFMFRVQGQVYMVCGGNESRRKRYGTGEVVLYRATQRDLTQWEYLGPIFQYRDNEVINVECPNLFPLGDKWVLMVSPHRSCEYFVGNFDLGARRFDAETRGVLDPGPAYATNISFDDKGRALLWMWGMASNPHNPTWDGCMVLPRVLSIGKDGFLRQSPAAEFESLRGPTIQLPPLALRNETRVLAGVRGDCLEFLAEVSAGGAESFGFELRRSTAGRPGATITITPSRSDITLGSARALVGWKDRYRLHVFLDKCTIEVYVDDGLAAIYNTTEASPQDLELAFFSVGGSFPSGDPYFPTTREMARLESFQAWLLRPAQFSLERFHL